MLTIHIDLPIVPLITFKKNLRKPKKFDLFGDNKYDICIK